MSDLGNGVSATLRAFGQAAAVLLLFCLVGLTVLICSMIWQVRQNRAEEETRQAACLYLAEVIVEIGDHVMELPASFSTSYKSETGKAIRSETPPDAIGYSDDETRFCLDGPQGIPAPVTSFKLGPGGDFGKFAQENNFPGDFYYVEFFRERPLAGQHGPPKADLLAEKPEEMVIYDRHPEGDYVSAVMRGIGDKGYRSSAFCTFLRKFEHSKRPALWTCQFRVSDVVTGLNYYYIQTQLEQENLDLAWVSLQSELVVEKLRWMLAKLSVSVSEI